MNMDALIGMNCPDHGASRYFRVSDDMALHLSDEPNGLCPWVITASDWRTENEGAHLTEMSGSVFYVTGIAAVHRVSRSPGYMI